MAKYIISPQAKVDIAEILEYIAEDDLGAAVSVYGNFIETFQLLADNPKSGRTRGELDPILRSHPVKRYLIFYRILDGEVEIARVLHSARDIEAIFDN